MGSGASTQRSSMAMKGCTRWRKPKAGDGGGVSPRARASSAACACACSACATAACKASTAAARHPLASCVDYWELGTRLTTVSVAEVDGFLTRWAGTYVEDRLRNDWLLELGRRRDWATFAREFPRFRMNDDREVTCYALLTQHQAGADVRRAAREAGYAQRDADDGCQLLARTLFEDKQLTAAEVWQEVRLSAENNRPRAARAAASLLGEEPAKAVGQIFDNPARWLAQRKPSAQPEDRQLRTVAVIPMSPRHPQPRGALVRQCFFWLT